MESNSTIEELRSVQPLGAATRARADRAHLAGAGDLCAALDDAYESVELLLRQASGFLARQAQERPQVLLACAAGLGFVLGGGLVSRTGALLARAGARLVLAHFVQTHFVQNWSETGDLTHPAVATD